MQYYEVAPLKIIRSGQDTFTYACPERLPCGQLVTIPVGKNTYTGLVIKRVTKPQYDTKPISAVLSIPAIPTAYVKTYLWMSDYYATPLATVLQTTLPRGLTKKRRSKTMPIPFIERDRTNFVLNQSQQQVIEHINKSTPGTVVLHGITGSGKTAVYIELAKQAATRGESSMILVPEIALTSQLIAEFMLHFQNVIVTHSRQTEAERHQVWLKALQQTEPCIIIGPRSALFLPVPNLGLIVVDEAHEPSYKQDQSPRYSALRVASVLASQFKCKVIQGSATPLVSEYYLAKQTSRPIVEMQVKARQNTVQPTVSLIDMTKKTHFTRHRLFSNELFAAIERTLQSGSQVLIFHNRRGSASTTLCENCSWQAICPRCFVPYTLHADAYTLRCHICGNHERVPTNCPVCQSTDIIHKGIGTKLIESELRKLFPTTTIARFDGDSANTETVESRYAELYSGAIDIIIGTQVIAKGLDLPNLRTVGVVQADAGLSLPDYGASERTFQLLAQVVGRVGRSEQKSSVIIQSYQPNAAAVQMGITQNYTDFYTATIAERQKALFPPFTYLLKLTCVYKTEAVAIKNAKRYANTLRTAYPGIQILGPTPAFYERQHDTYRWQLVIKSSKRAVLTQIAGSLPVHWQYDIDPISLL